MVGQYFEDKPRQESEQKSWFFRYKLYHIPFWLVYHYLWWVVAMGNPWKAASSLVFLPLTIKFSFYVVMQALAVYFNLYYLIPKYLEKQRISIYLAYFTGTVLAATLVIISGYYFSSYATGYSLGTLYGGGSDADCFYRFLGYALPSTVASMTLAMSIKMAKNWVQARQREQELEKERLESELKFLRNQFNPHFLFNTINSIFFLIHKNPDMASDALAKFSDLLRYQLYECNDLRIPLSREILYMENFIELEKLRRGNIRISTALGVGLGNSMEIAPFVLMIFVENAFKHVSRDTERQNWIDLNLKTEGPDVIFEIQNSRSDDHELMAVPYSGIGLANVRRRLELLYPEQYDLRISGDNDRFSVYLRMSLGAGWEVSQVSQIQTLNV